MSISPTRERFAGVDPVYPEPGDLVEIFEGQDVGETLEVIKVTGYAFGTAYRVYVRRPNGEEVWYWPWNFKIIINQ